MEVRTARAMEAADVLEETTGVREVSLFGTALHVAVDEAVASPEGLVRAAVGRADIAIEQIKPVRATLEHAFLALAAEGSEEGVND